MRIVVGLGNPGLDYHGTRHNIGFEVLTELARRWQADSPRNKHHSLLREVTCSGHKVLLLTPQTYMNLSGTAVHSAVDFYKLPLSDLLVVCDDLNLPLGTLRARPHGSAGGQNGLNNIIKQLGTHQFPRLRVGIGPVPPRWNTTDFVLARFTHQEQELVDRVVYRAASAVECWITEGIQPTMNQFNQTPPKPS